MHTPTYENMEDTELKFGEVQLRWEQKPLPMHNLHISIFHPSFFKNTIFQNYSFSVFDISFVLAQHKGNIENAKGIILKNNNFEKS